MLLLREFPWPAGFDIFFHNIIIMNKMKRGGTLYYIFCFLKNRTYCDSTSVHKNNNNTTNPCTSRNSILVVVGRCIYKCVYMRPEAR